MDRTLPFDIPNHTGYCHLRRYADQEVNVIRHYVPFFDQTSSLFCQSAKNRAYVFSQHPKQLFSSIFWDENNMIFALPSCMAQALVVFHGDSFLGCSFGGSQLNPTEDRSKSQTSIVSPAEPGGFLLDY